MIGRRIAAVVIDATAAAALLFAGFRLGLAIAPCAEQSECSWLTPIVIVLAVVALVLYFGLSQYFWRTTPGRRLLRAD